MLETLFILLILLFIIFPFPVLAATLGVLTTAFLHRKYRLFERQPPEGKRNLMLDFWTFLANFLASVGLAAVLASLVHFFIIANPYLFFFNLLFGTLVSLRWFDFTHHIYRRFIFKFKGLTADPPSESVFVVCQGIREQTRAGIGPALTFVDAGYLKMRDSEILFDGIFFKQKFDGSNISHVEKSSLEKLKIVPQTKNLPGRADALLFILKERFYPFKSLETRDKIYKRFLALQPA